MEIKRMSRSLGRMINNFVLHGWIFLFLLVMCAMLVSCEKKKVEGKLEVSEQEFSIRQDSEFAYVVDVWGKIKNVGTVDVKKVVVTGNCRSCGNALVAGAWMISPDIEKTSEQKAIINYIAPGLEENFSFRGVAFMYNRVPEKPELPEGLEVVITSFESVAK